MIEERVTKMPLLSLLAVGPFGMGRHGLNHSSAHRHPNVEPAFGRLLIREPLPKELDSSQYCRAASQFAASAPSPIIREVKPIDPKTLMQNASFGG